MFTAVAALVFQSEFGKSEMIAAIDSSTWNYADAFSRNLGLIAPSEQQTLRNCRVAIPGMGGVGGIHLMTLARMGVGKFRISDADQYEVKNFNRQFGASVDNLGRPKAEVMAEYTYSVNPGAEVDTLQEVVTEKNVGAFLEDVDLVVDAVDFFAFKARRLIFKEARRRGIWTVTAGPIGFSTAWLAFDPNGMSFDEYFDIHDGMEEIDMFCAFALGLAPRLTQSPYFDPSYIDSSGKGPSVACACQLAAGVVGAEAVKILLGRGKVHAAPVYHQFDAYRYLLKSGRLRFGNRGPWQRIRRKFMRRKLIELGYGKQ